MNQIALQELRASAEKIRNLVKTTVAAVVDAGNELILVKEKIGHGNFKRWIESECGFSHSTALNYMRAAEFAKAKSATVALLNPRSVYMLAAPTAPTSAVEQIESRLSAGEMLSDRQIKDTLEQARYDIRQAAAAAERDRKTKNLSAKRKRQREQWKREEEDRQRQQAERVGQIVGALIGNLGADKCRFLVETMDGQFVWEIMEALRTQIGGAA